MQDGGAIPAVAADTDYKFFRSMRTQRSFREILRFDSANNGPRWI